MYLLQAAPAKPLDVDAIRDHLESIGESVLVAGDARALKIHVHNERPDQVIAYGLTLGSLSRISVENLDNQARDVRETRAAAFTADDARRGRRDRGRRRDGTVRHRRATRLPARGRRPARRSSPSSRATALPRSSATSAWPRVVQGGQTANPSTGELLEAVERVDAREVLLLPNNPNVVLAARQVAAMSDRPVAVVPTRNAAEGFAALLALDPTPTRPPTPAR